MASFVPRYGITGGLRHLGSCAGPVTATELAGGTRWLLTGGATLGGRGELAVWETGNPAPAK